MKWSAKHTVSTLAVVALFAFGAAFAAHNARELSTTTTVPVTQIVHQAPPVSPEEASRAVSSAKDLSIAFRVVSERLLPSVVTIENTPKTTVARGTQRMPSPHALPDGRNPFEGTPFEDFFKDFPGGQGFRFEMPPTQQMPQRGMGSGVIYDSSGLVLTNHHVVAGDGEVTVRLTDGREFEAAKVWSDPKTDIAVVKIDGADDLVAADLGDSDEVSVGDWVLALGQPFGLESTVTSGIISAKGRGIGITPRENFLQTDAAINPGNSGGPLVNLDGQVIGINTAISSRSGGNDGVGFAVPINLAKWVADQLASEGIVHRAYLGVGIQPVTAALAEQFQVKPRHGVVVTDVYPDTPAAKAGLQSGDVIVDYAGLAIRNPQELQVAVERSEIGRPHQVGIVRDGKSMNLTFTPEEQPDSFGMVRTGRSPSQGAETPENSEFGKLGFQISELNADVAERLGLEGVEGVVITSVDSGSPAEQAGLESGMVITQVNRQSVKNVDEAVRALKDAQPKEGVLLLVRTDAGSRFLVIRP